MNRAIIDNLKTVIAYEEIEVHRSTNRICITTSRDRDIGRRSLSQAWNSPRDVFQLEKKYGGLGVSDLRRLRQLEDENNQLRKLVADLSLDKQILQDVLKKKP